jgi:hypothetical protein
VPVTHTRRSAPLPVNGPQILAYAAMGVGSAVFVLMHLFLPPPLVLPALSIALSALAGGLSLIAWRMPRPHQSLLGYWDLAGAAAFIGIAAALMSDPEQALPLMQSARAPNPA